MCLCPFRGKYIFRKTRVFCNLDALEFVSSCPIYWWKSVWWPTEKLKIDFSCGAKLWRITLKYSAKKRSTPWIIFLTPAPRPLQVTFQCWWTWTYLFVPFCRDIVFQQKTHVLQFGCVLTHCFEFVPDVWPMLIQHYNYNHYIFISKD